MKKILKILGISIVSLYLIAEILNAIFASNPEYIEELIYPEEYHWYSGTLTYLIFFYDNNDGYVGG
mgnify:FL=1